MSSGLDSGAPFILLVDDAPEIALVVRRLSQHAGQIVESCGDVATAWEYLCRKRPDLVVLDVNLPGENGLELCRRIKEEPALAGLPVALFSHWDRPEDIAAGLEAGAEYVVSKDLLCRPEEWQKRIREVLMPITQRPYRRPLGLTAERIVAMRPEVWIEAVNPALQQLALRIGPDVLGVLLRRAVQRAAVGLAADALRPDGCGFHADWLACAKRPGMLVTVTVALAEQVWCILGTAASAPLRSTLAARFPALAELF